MAKEIKFRVKLNVDGKNQLVTATSTTKDLQNVMRSAQVGLTSNALGAVYQSSLQVTQLTGKSGRRTNIQV